VVSENLLAPNVGFCWVRSQFTGSAVISGVESPIIAWFAGFLGWVQGILVSITIGTVFL
jgi:hypothetical protein